MSVLRRFRTKKRWSQAELDRRAGISRSSVAAIENSALVPSVHTALALAHSLDCTVEELFGDKRDGTIAWAWHPFQESPAFWEASPDCRTGRACISPGQSGDLRLVLSGISGVRSAYRSVAQGDLQFRLSQISGQLERN